MVGLLCNLPREVFLPKHVAWHRRVPRRGDLRRWIHRLRLHSPHVIVADVVVYHGGKGWREGQASRGKERMIKTQASQEVKQHLPSVNTHLKNVICCFQRFKGTICNIGIKWSTAVHEENSVFRSQSFTLYCLLPFGQKIQ